MTDFHGFGVQVRQDASLGQAYFVVVYIFHLHVGVLCTLLHFRVRALVSSAYAAILLHMANETARCQQVVLSRSPLSYLERQASINSEVPG